MVEDQSDHPQQFQELRFTSTPHLDLTAIPVNTSKYHGNINTYSTAIELLEVDITALQATEICDEVVDHISQE